MPDLHNIIENPYGIRVNLHTHMKSRSFFREDLVQAQGKSALVFGNIGNYTEKAHRNFEGPRFSGDHSGIQG
jgi:hypothetical protein